MTISPAPEGRPEPPQGLGAAGTALWVAITGTFDLDPRELLVLALAARQADDVAALESALAEQGMTVPGSKGQPRLTAVVTEVRQCRLALAKLLDQLHLPTEEDDVVGRSPASRQAQAAARSRWGRVGRDRELRGMD